MTLDQVWTDEVDSYLAALERGDRSAALGQVRALHGEGHDVLTLIQRLLAPAQLRVGELWVSDAWSVAQEHAATAISESVLTSLAVERELHASPAAGGRADADRLLRRAGVARAAGADGHRAPAGRGLRRQLPRRQRLRARPGPPRPRARSPRGAAQLLAVGLPPPRPPAGRGGPRDRHPRRGRRGGLRRRRPPGRDPRRHRLRHVGHRGRRPGAPAAGRRTARAAADPPRRRRGVRGVRRPRDLRRRHRAAAARPAAARGRGPRPPRAGLAAGARRPAPARRRRHRRRARHRRPRDRPPRAGLGVRRARSTATHRPRSGRRCGRRCAARCTSCRRPRGCWPPHRTRRRPPEPPRSSPWPERVIDERSRPGVASSTRGTLVRGNLPWQTRSQRSLRSAFRTGERRSGRTTPATTPPGRSTTAASTDGPR